MLKLIHYEFRKTWFTKLILLGITALLEVVFLISLYGELTDYQVMSVFLLTMLAIGGVMIIGLQSVVTLHRDMNTRQSYMLFMTPNSCYKILGAKMVENGLSILVAGAFFFALGALDITLVMAKEGELSQLWEMIQRFIATINQEIPLNIDGVASFIFNLLSGWIGVVSAAFLADVISAALLNGKPHNGIVSFLIFIGISLLSGWLSSLAIRGVDSITLSFVVDGGLSLALAAVMYVVSAQIMERKLSV